MSLAKFAETMIGSKDLSATAAFYTKFLGMEVFNAGDGKSFITLKDPKTNQNLLIVADPRIQNALPSIESENLEKTLESLSTQGGKIIDQAEYPSMKVANVQDPDGRNMCIWQTV